MQSQGMDEQSIIVAMQGKGVSYRDISDALSQSKIKAAVTGQYNENLDSGYIETNSTPQVQSEGMQASIMQNPQNQYEEQFPAYDQNAHVQQPGQDYSRGNSDYIPASLSSDTITEISEQIVSEKLTDVRKKMEKIISSKNELDARTDSIEERLKRIEKIIDTLQTSVLRKVGDYVTNVDDIKKELVETQKTIGKVLSSKHHSDKK
jgi:hypothetical protein